MMAKWGLPSFGKGGVFYLFWAIFSNPSACFIMPKSKNFNKKWQKVIMIDNGYYFNGLAKR